MAVDIDSLYRALVGLESGGRQSAVNSRSGARGVSQIMPENWNPWSKETFGKVVPQTEYAQRLVTKTKLQEYWDKFGSPQAALAAWFAGPDDGAGYARGDASTMQKSDGNLTVEQYVNNIMGRLEETDFTPANSGPGVYDAEQKLQAWLNELSHGVAGGRRASPEEVIVRNFVQATDLTRNVDEPEEVSLEQGQEPTEQPILGFEDPTKDFYDFGQPQPEDLSTDPSQGLSNPEEQAEIAAMIEATAQPEDYADYDGQEMVKPTGANGRIDNSQLVEIGKGHKLAPAAANAFKAMKEAARQDGVNITITDSYRDYATQVDLVRRKGLYSQGGLAAKPGTSNHGWGVAVDVASGRDWLKRNGSRFGFHTIPREPWHWEYRG